MDKENKCLEGHLLIENIFIPCEYLASLEKFRDLTFEAVTEAESNESDDNGTGKKGGERYGLCFYIKYLVRARYYVK